MAKHVYPNNRIPDKARTNRFLRPFIIVGILVKTLLGGNPKNVERAIDEGNWDTDITNKISRLKLKLKMVYYRYAYEMNYNEFIGFKLEHKPRKECIQYISSYEKMRLYDEVIIDTPSYSTFFNKKNAYDAFEPYFKRDVIYVESRDDVQKFIDICSKHKKLIMKPVDHNGGVGVTVIDQDKENPVQKFLTIIERGPHLVEEYVISHPVLKAFHPQSVNTLRFTTYYENGELTKLYGMARFGEGNSVVDNAGAGGISANVDVNTGVINSNGFTHKGKEVVSHPDTNVQFKGTQLPMWDEFSDIIASIVKVCPEQRYVGWDFACCEDGWKLIETNAGPGILAAQMCYGCGFRDKYSKTIFKESKYAKQYSTGKL